MNERNPDHALGDDTAPSTGPASGAAGGPFVSPPTPEPIDLTATKVWTIADILAEAELPEKRASICLKANLQARHDEILTELAGLVDARGQLLDDDEAAVGDIKPSTRARELVAEDEVVLREMRKSMWYPLFRGKTSDDMAVFNKEHLPKSEGAPMIDYYNRLISECSREPELSIEDVTNLRKKLGSKPIATLIETVAEVCARGGVDVPKLPGFLRNLADG